MTERESRSFLASALRSVADHIDAMPDAPPSLIDAIGGDFRLEALSRGRGCQVSVTIAAGSADVAVAVNDPDPEPGEVDAGGARSG